MTRMGTSRPAPRIAEGFRGQVHLVLPRRVLDEAERHPLARPLYPTAAGWYPRARGHFRARPAGAAEHIFILCVAGDGWCELDGRRLDLRPRAALSIPRGTPHAYGAAAADPWSIHWVHFAGDDAGAFLARLGGAGARPAPARALPGIRRRFRELYAALRPGAAPPRVLLASQILRHLLAEAAPDDLASAPPAPRARELERALALMKARLGGTLRLADLAREAGLSPAHFAALFRRHTGCSPVDYFIHLKMQAACRLLGTTGLHAKEIAAALGYDDPYYFSRAFRKVIGVSPRRYRAQPKG